MDEHEHHDDERVRAASRRGTQHLGLLILRVGLGAVLVAHGLQKLFGWWGGQGLNGFKNALSDIGYQHADILTYCAAGGEIAAGVLLVLGLFTPLAAAGALAYLINSLLAGDVGPAQSQVLPVLPARWARIRDHPDRAWPPPSSWSDPDATASTPVAAGPGGRSSGRLPRWWSASAPASRCGCCSTAPTR